MKTLKEKCQEIVSKSNQYNKNLKKFLSEKDINILEQVRGKNLSEKAYNVIFENYKDCSCGKEVTFISYTKGYRTFCSKTCQATYREANWSNDMKEHRSSSISKSVKAIWNNPDNKEMLKERNVKVGIAAQKMWDNATEEWITNRSNRISKKVEYYSKNNPEDLNADDLSFEFIKIRKKL